MDKPPVSISIIAYNQVEFIAEAVRSAAEQDYDPLEVVVADDGSKDGTADLVRRLAGEYPKRVIPLVGGPNLGVTGNSNRALGACKGKYVAFQGGDDVLLPGKICKQVDWLEEAEERVLCGHDVEMFDSETGKRIVVPNHCPRSGQGARWFVRCGCPFGATATMIRRTAVPLFGFDERLPIVSDWKLWIDCLAAGGRYGFVEGVLARYRKHARSITAQSVADQEMHGASFADLLATISLVEASYPHLLRECQLARARALQSEGVFRLQRHELFAARAYLRQALRGHHLGSWKAAAWLALTWAPGVVRGRLARHRARGAEGPHEEPL